MEVTEVSEKRFERAMERLFSGSSTPAASSARVPSPVKEKKEDEENTSGRVFQTAGVATPLSGSHGCRPWDRGDLLRRLATYKSISWFGKPQVAGPVACARRGWVNVDIDLLACEICGSRLSFPVSSSWSRHQVEQAALVFAEKLDTAHKGLCAWKNNPCAETLAHFPPTPVSVLRGAYTDRCEALLQLSALPVISDAAKSLMKLSRGPQVDQLLSELNPPSPGFLVGNGASSSSTENEIFANSKAYYEAQRMIAVCGWEPRLLPYTVDCEDRSGAQSIHEQIGTSHGPGPSVTVHMQGGQQSKVAQGQIQSTGTDVSDPASAVLDCNLCGASVGLWNFATLNRPAPLLNSGLEELFSSKNRSSGSNPVRDDAAGAVGGPLLASPEAAEMVDAKPPEVVPVNVLERAAPPKGVLDLKLTIAGGPPPTRLIAPASVPPSFGIPGLPHTVMQPRKIEAITYAAASYESRRPAHQGRGHNDTGTPTYHVEGEVIQNREMKDAEESKDAEYFSKRKREKGNDESEGVFSPNTKRKREVGSQWPGFTVKLPARDLPHASSVNAIDTCYPPKQENSMESVDNLPLGSDGQGANTAEYHVNGPESRVQAEHSMSRQDGIDAGKSICGGRVEEGVQNNVVVICPGAGISGSHETEIQGVEANLERSESVAEFATDVIELMEEHVSGRGLMDEFIPEDTLKAIVTDDHEGSRQAMLGISHTFVKDTSSAGVSERYQRNVAQRDADEDANAGSTLETTNAIIQGVDMVANIQVKEVTAGRTVGESPSERNEEVQSHPSFPPGLLLDDVKKLEIQTGEFDPIRQHRHFCPWVNAHVAAATSGTGSSKFCGWQIVLDALQPQPPSPHQQHQHQQGSVESEFTGSKYKDDPILSVRKLLGSVSSNYLPSS
ncbi:uncharacterized protein [Physcomitrium patens]|uniref:Uncharacterized protein n=1 Tax=Physcomitrium patens TaxID=3218 RepID=A0A2K1KAI5_PHYPA|nr:uncharacterized protein LOC112284769 isoform X1 [Physcomitrium patens]XP_024380729.1 uncharacterized protein LOC112284769 isoform X1 [Physcomitrium patens]XP_024380730.1 uncharacterized protein LOC112284769 isoform X1 [Physcomitrium patens]XP_024380731.1 uncharacterized protein LOC112284769 isoform X1 [Physcomitrium patens]XP_024380732.1 uncharacterized protein LOC112284769 isoform X1 [Physcomitrium patens]PNR50791.1 hypothetical protein PHYPA_009977 [Physcomitrium patens]|eukprot:XP_024380728.1 uncharacterized protein LOC112284769 isoform X1 [Physcomitrella patens]